MQKIPTFDELMNPLLKALHALGGSGSNEEIYERVVADLGLPTEVLEELHRPDRSNQTEVEYRLGWAKTYLKKFGVINNSERGVWALVDSKNPIAKIDSRKVVKDVREADRLAKSENDGKVEFGSEGDAEASWRSQLHTILTQDLDPAAFERLTQRILREAGFIQVEVTGRSGDGGIDGKGILRIGGIMSFHVLFQCKKYQGVITASQIRDFRGALVGRADKGLFITTGTFSRDAIKEATRDGAPPIDLIDGDQLADKLKELRLGVKTEVVESVHVDKEFFANI